MQYPPKQGGDLDPSQPASDSTSDFQTQIMTFGHYLLRSRCMTSGCVILMGALWCLGLILFLGSSSAKLSREAKIAYFIQVADANVKMVPRLVRVLHHPKNVYAVHFDKKIPSSRLEPIVNKLKTKYKNVHFMESETITYKGVSMVLNTISAIDFLLGKDLTWDYFINLSGSDYPLVSPRNQRRLLGTNAVVDRSINFLQLSTNRTFWKLLKRYRFSSTHYDTALSLRETDQTRFISTWNKNPLMKELGIEFVQGEAWMILHRSTCEFTIHSSYARKLLLLLSIAQDPEEHYFPMLLWNHPKLNNTLARHALRAVFWTHEGKKSGQHPYAVDQQDENGNWVFWKRIERASSFFVRKMSVPDSTLMDLIDRTKSGVHPESNREQVSKSSERAKSTFACITDIDARRYDSSVISCFAPPRYN